MPKPEDAQPKKPIEKRGSIPGWANDSAPENDSLKTIKEKVKDTPRPVNEKFKKADE
jgi:hypothetical protein